MNDYDAYDDDYVDSSHQNNNVANDMLPLTDEHQPPEVDFDDPSIAALPRVLLMGPRRAGKTSIQVRHIYTYIHCTMYMLCYSYTLLALLILSSELFSTKCHRTRLYFD